MEATEASPVDTTQLILQDSTANSRVNQSWAGYTWGMTRRLGSGIMSGNYLFSLIASSHFTNDST